MSNLQTTTDKSKKTFNEWCDLVAALCNSEKLSALNLDMGVYDDMMQAAAIRLGFKYNASAESWDAFSEAINHRALTPQKVKEAADWYLIQGNEQSEGYEPEPEDADDGCAYSDFLQDNDKEDY